MKSPRLIDFHSDGLMEVLPASIWTGIVNFSARDECKGSSRERSACFSFHDRRNAGEAMMRPVNVLPRR